MRRTPMTPAVWRLCLPRQEDGSPFAMRRVTLMVVRDGLIAEARLFMEPVDVGGQDIDEAVRQLYKPSAR